MSTTKSHASSTNAPLIVAGAIGIAAGIALAGYLLRFARPPGNAEHTTPDLAPDQPHPDANHRAPEAFRPDPTASVPANERDGLRPATGPEPTLVRGNAGDRARAPVVV